jgi:hypothetical protein
MGSDGQDGCSLGLLRDRLGTIERQILEEIEQRNLKEIRKFGQHGCRNLYLAQLELLIRGQGNADMCGHGRFLQP